MSERFNTAAADWDKGDTRQNIAHSVFQTIVSRIALSSSMDIMDFGAGTGLLSFKIAPLVKSVMGVDLSHKMLEQIEAKNSTLLQVKPIYRDILQEPLDHQFHGIVSSMALHHVSDTKALCKSFHSHLKRSGFIALADLEAEDGSFHNDNTGVHHFGFDKMDLRNTLEDAGFENVRFHEAYRVVKGEKDYPVFVVTALKK